MPASLYGERFLGRKEPGWHRLGKVFAEDLKISPADAVIMADCDYWVRKLPLTVKLPNGEARRTDQVAIVRYPKQQDTGSYHIMGYASEDYEVVQNIELGFLLEDLGKEWPVETVGALGEGEQMFICLFAGEDEVVKGGREQIKRYLVMSNAHDGKRSLRIMLTDVRTECWNTLMAGINSAVMTTTIPHRSDIRDEAKFRLDLIASVRRQQVKLMEEYRAMAVAKVVESQVDEILAAAYPDPKPWRKQLLADIVVNDEALSSLVNDNKVVANRLLKDLKKYGTEYEARLIRAKGLRELAKERFELVNQESPVIANTAWAAWQGVTEVESYRGTGSVAEANSIMFGERAQNMSRAYAKALEFCV